MRGPFTIFIPLVVFAAAAGIAACSDDGNTANDTDAADSAPIVEASAAEDAPILDADIEPPFDCTTDADPLELPQHLRCTGLYDRWSKKTTPASVREYEPALALWSDGATKRRWISLPQGTKIDTTNMDEWVFPVGTKFWKEFSLSGKRIETRLFSKVASGVWLHTSYRWSPDETAATRDDAGEWAGLDGGDAASYEIPGAAKCEQCHNGRTDKVLGFEAVSLGLPAAKGITLATLVTEGLLTAPPKLTALAIADDGTTKSAAAMGWLHANCGTTCHNANPAATCAYQGLHFRLGYDELTNASYTGKDYGPYLTAVGKASTTGAAPKVRISPHDVEGSAVHYFISRRDPFVANGQMPPIDSHVVDTLGVGAVDGWIAAMPAK